MEFRKSAALKFLAHTAILIFIFASSAFAQTDVVTDDQVGNSPFDVIYNHLLYLQPDTYEPTKAARSLSPENPAKLSIKAIKLKEILDGRGFFIDINRLPENNNHYDSVSRDFIYIINHNEPRIYVERTKGVWQYSQTTIREIDVMYSELYPLNGAIRTLFKDPSWQQSFLGIKLWQWVSFLALCLVTGLFFSLVYLILRKLGHAIAHVKRTHQDLISDSISRLTRLLSLVIALYAFKSLIPALHLAPKINSFLVKGLEILSIFFVVMILNEIMHLIFSYISKWAAGTASTMDDQLVPLLSRLASIVIWTVGIIYILDYLQINITALLAGISIGGLAIALAAQDTVKNFFGSVMIFLDKPFQIGDWISFDNVDGVVERVGVRSTRVRTFANSLTYVPNGIFAEKVIDNKGLRVFRRYKTEIGITYDTPTYLIDLFVEGISELIAKHPYTRKDSYEVGLSAFGESSINILIYAFFAVDNWTDELRGKHDLMKGIINLAETLGVRFAFPTQTLFIEEMPGQKSLTPQKAPSAEAKVAARKTLDKVIGEFVAPDKEEEREKNLGG
jgi:MscS family membrane protein